MKRAERMIRQQIDTLSLEHIAPMKHEIEQAIKFMYWQGSFSKKKYDKMNMLLAYKYEDIMNKHNNAVQEAMDRDYHDMRKRYGLE